MDGIANVAKMQQSQIDTQSQHSTTIQKNGTVNVVKELQEDNSQQVEHINSKKDIEKLVEQLNDTMSMMNKDLKFGVDSNDIFYVSVIDTKSNRMIRRFPAEKAAEFLPKMKEVTGILFDSVG